MVIKPLATMQESRGEWAPAGTLVTTRWGSQYVGLVMGALAAVPETVTLRLLLADNAEPYQISQSVVVTGQQEGPPSTWVTPSLDAIVEFYDAEAAPGEWVELPVPVHEVMTAGDWGIVLRAIEFGKQNLQAYADGIEVVVVAADETEPPGEPQTYRFTIDRPFGAGDEVVLEVLRDGDEIGYMRVVVG